MKAPAELEDDEHHRPILSAEDTQELTGPELLQRASAVIEEGANKAYDPEDQAQMRKLARIVPYAGLYVFHRSHLFASSDLIVLRSVDPNNKDDRAKSELENAIDRAAQIMNKISGEHHGLDPEVR